ncbi:MAG: hypothetical protein RIQ60_58 [Pseudomonadota bacterium]|jgi:hypothetical protein
MTQTPLRLTSDTKPVSRRTRAAAAPLALALGLALAACGGGSSGPDTGSIAPSNCSALASQQSALLNYLQDWYYFYASMPNPLPSPAGFSTVEGYFDALLDTSQDHWSNVQPSASFDAFFNNGQSLGYGLFVAGQSSDPLPLRVRYVTPDSPAALAGITRGMVIDRINGVDPATLKANNDFSALSPASAGTTIDLVLHTTAAPGTPMTRTLSANVHNLVPVDAARVLRAAGAGKPAVGYLYYMNFINSASAPLSAAVNTLKTAGVTELVLDLRYNPGGLIELSRQLASSLAGPALDGRVFVQLSYNNKHSASNRSYSFNATGLDTLNLSRVYVLSGVRTCSASELVINGLAPHVQVIQVGAATCGKPYGFNPVPDGCGRTVSAVNFSLSNSANSAPYVNGLGPSTGCAVTDDFDHPLGDPNEALAAAALRHIDTGSCAATAGAGPARAPLQATPNTDSSGRRRVTPDGDPPWASQLH